jgi:hypothetical protein
MAHKTAARVKALKHSLQGVAVIINWYIFSPPAQYKNRGLRRIGFAKRKAMYGVASNGSREEARMQIDPVSCSNSRFSDRQKSAILPTEEASQ